MARRAKGEGSIYQRPDGMWVGSIEVPSYDGRRKQKRVYSRDYRKLVEKLKQAKSDLDSGVTITNRTKVRDWLHTWITEVHRDQVRPSTRQSYEVVIRHINSCIGDRRIDALTPSDVRGMITELGNGRRRTQKAYIILQAALKDALREGIVRRNVCEAVHKPKVSAEARESFELEEAHAILSSAATDDAMSHARWLAAFMTGLRQGEVLGLQWDRIDMDAGTAEISWQLQTLTREHGCGPAASGKWPCGKVKGAYCTTPVLDVPPDFEVVEIYRSLVLTRPKTQAGHRLLPLVPPLWDALRRLRDADTGDNPHGLVFHHRDGRPISPREDWDGWQNLIRDAGVAEDGETVPMHRARHTTATIMRAAGVDEQTRMELLGHTSEKAQRIYAHANLERQRAAMAALAELAPPPSGAE